MPCNNFTKHFNLFPGDPLTDKNKPNRLSRAELVRQSYDQDRARNPHRFINESDGAGPDFLFVENVAAMLSVNVDFVRRIPRADLPASRAGQRLIYAREDVEEYLGSRRDTGTARYVAERAPSKRGATVASGDGAPVAFDPASFARSLAKDKK